MVRHRLTDEQWNLIADIFPPPKPTGRPPTDRREVMDAILWILRTGSQWRDLPSEFPSWKTIWDLFDKWNSNGILDEVLNRLRAAQVDLGKVDEELWCVDGTIVRAARCTSGGGKKGIQRNPAIIRLAVLAGV